MGKLNKNQILNLFDENISEFPALDNANINFGQTRLSVFRDASDWLLAIEIVGFCGEHFNDLYAFGSNCKKNELIYSEEVLFFPEYPIDDDGNFLISPYNIHVYIKNNEEIRIKPTREDYKDAGIDPEPFTQTKLLRFLCHFYTHWSNWTYSDFPE